MCENVLKSEKHWWKVRTSVKQCENELPGIGVVYFNEYTAGFLIWTVTMLSHLLPPLSRSFLRTFSNFLELSPTFSHLLPPSPTFSHLLFPGVFWELSEDGPLGARETPGNSTKHWIECEQVRTCVKMREKIEKCEHVWKCVKKWETLVKS